MANVHEPSSKVAGMRRLGERDDKGLSLFHRQGRPRVLSSRDACGQQRLATLRPADPHVRSMRGEVIRGQVITKDVKGKTYYPELDFARRTNLWNANSFSAHGGAASLKRVLRATAERSCGIAPLTATVGSASFRHSSLSRSLKHSGSEFGFLVRR
jgi:hypothetical protein